MQPHTYTNAEFTGEYCEAKTLFLELESFLELMQTTVPEGRLMATSLRTRIHLKVAVSAPRPTNMDEFREYVQLMSLPLLTAGVLIGSMGPEWKTLAEGRLRQFKSKYDSTRSCLGHVLVGMCLSPIGRERHFERLASIPSY